MRSAAAGLTTHSGVGRNGDTVGTLCPFFEHAHTSVRGAWSEEPRRAGMERGAWSVERVSVKREAWTGGRRSVTPGQGASRNDTRTLRTHPHLPICDVFPKIDKREWQFGGKLPLKSLGDSQERYSAEFFAATTDLRAATGRGVVETPRALSDGAGRGASQAARGMRGLVSGRFETFGEYAILAGVLARCLFAVGCFDFRRYQPPRGTTAVDQLVASLPKTLKFAVVEQEAKQYVVWIGRPRGAIVSGPPVYVFDSDGKS
jgi:hypothetical protein